MAIAEEEIIRNWVDEMRRGNFYAGTTTLEPLVYDVLMSVVGWL